MKRTFSATSTRMSIFYIQAKKLSRKIIVEKMELRAVLQGP